MQRTTKYKCTEATKEKLLAAIIKLVKEKGYKNVTVRDICKESGVSNGAFYHHYGSKDALTREAYYNIDCIAGDIIDYCNSLPPLEGLQYLLESHLRYISEDVGLITTEYLKLLLDSVNESSFNTDRPYYKAVKQQIDRCVATDVIKDKLDNLELVTHTIRFVRGLTFDWCIHHGSYNLIDQYKFSFKLFMNGIIKQD